MRWIKENIILEGLWVNYVSFLILNREKKEIIGVKKKITSDGDDEGGGLNGILLWRNLRTHPRSIR